MLALGSPASTQAGDPRPKDPQAVDPQAGDPQTGRPPQGHPQGNHPPEGHPPQGQELFEMSLQDLLQVEVVSGASRYEQKVTRAPAPVSIVTAAEIHALGYTTLAEVLAGVRGFYVSYDRNYSYVGSRGFSPPGDYNTRVLLLVDGHRLNDNVYDSAALGPELPLDLSVIDRIEVIRGPSSSLYGASAFFAVVNIITRNGEAVGGVQADPAVGSFASVASPVTVGGRTKGGLEYMVEGSLYRNPGPDRLYYREFDSPATNNGYANNADGEHAERLFGKLQRGGWTLNACWGSREKTVPTGSYKTVFNDARNGTTDQRGFLELVREWAPAPATQAQARLHYDRYRYDGSYVYDFGQSGASDLVINHDVADGEWWGAEAHIARVMRGKHQLLCGAEFEHDLRQDQKNWDRAVYLDDHRTGWRAGAYAQGELALHARWLLNVGLRQDVYESFGGTTNPRVALIHYPARTTTVKLLYGRAFRAPNAYELHYDDLATQKANPALGPENIEAAEAVLEQGIGSHVRTTASVFRYATRNLISLSQDPADSMLMFHNLDQVRAWGAEMELESQWAGGLHARASWTWQQSKNVTTDARLVNSPAHLVRAALIVPLPASDVLAGLELRYTSQRRTVAGGQVPGFLLTNLTLSRGTWQKGFSASLGVKNLFNIEYSDPASEEQAMESVPQDGRTFWAGVRLGL
jgi:outer membrane receptor for ferrienterochelin and colicins